MIKRTDIDTTAIQCTKCNARVGDITRYACDECHEIHFLAHCTVCDDWFEVDGAKLCATSIQPSITPLPSFNQRHITTLPSWIFEILKRVIKTLSEGIGLGGEPKGVLDDSGANKGHWR